MDTFTIVVLISLVQSAALVVTIMQLVKAKREHAVAEEGRNALHERFKGVEDITAEIDKRQLQLSSLERQTLSADEDHKKQLKELSDEYAKYKAIYDQLKTELALVEEDLEAQSFGVYKPHFDFSTSQDYKDKLNANYERQKYIVKDGRAAVCSKEWLVDGSRAQGQKLTNQYKKLMLRAFNGECDAACGRVKWNNIRVMEDRIRTTFEAINKLGEGHSISITPEYFDVKLEELRLTHELENKIYEEKEEQRRIREQIREEEKAAKEIARAQEEAEEDEQRYERAIEKAKADLNDAHGEEVGALSDKVRELELRLQQAHEEKARAVSRAQMTKSGHVYVISNIGSFRDGVLKIGMTRRLEPMDRIKELGDASVPFAFDVHAMIYSDNAPELECKLHSHFDAKRVNLVNGRKEFFTVTLDELEAFAKSINAEITFTKLAEAREYRETLALLKQASGKPDLSEQVSTLPSQLFIGATPIETGAHGAQA